MKTYFLFDHTVRIGKTTFTKGEPVKANLVRKACNGRLSTNGYLIDEAEAKVILNNRDIACMQQLHDGQTVLEIAEGDTEMATQFELAIEHLNRVGFAREDIAIARNNHLCRDTEGRPGWVGVKMTTLDDRFVGKNGKAVTLGNHNYVSIGTFMSRVEKNQPLFTHNQF